MNAVGQPISRVDGRLKVTGGARYTADIPLAAVAHAAIVYSTIASGRIMSIDTAAAENAPGVLAVLTYKNMPRMNPVPFRRQRCRSTRFGHSRSCYRQLRHGLRLEAEYLPCSVRRRSP